MSWGNESAALARQLAGLAIEGSSAWLTADHLDEALAARRDLLVLLGRVLGDVRRVPDPADAGGARRLSWRDGELTARGLEVDPVRALHQALRVHPAPRGRYRSAGATGEALSPGVGDWAAIGRRTQLAARAWDVVRPEILTAEERWSTVADVAALAEAVTIVEADLLAAARLPGRGGSVSELQDAVVAGLRLAAREATAIATAGPLPAWDQPGERPSLEPVALVRRVQDLAVAQDQLVVHLDRAAPLSPQSVVLVATGQVRFLAAAAAALTGSSQAPDMARWASDTSRRVAESILGGPQLGSTSGGNYPSRAVAQTRELTAYATSGQLTGRRLPLSADDVAALSSALARTPRVLGALARQADLGWRSGHWLMPNPRAETVQWISVMGFDREPQLCVRLSAAAAYSVARPGPPVQMEAARSGPTPPREILAGIGSTRRPVRPALPSQRPEGRSDLG